MQENHDKQRDIAELRKSGLGCYPSDLSRELVDMLATNAVAAMERVVESRKQMVLSSVDPCTEGERVAELQQLADIEGRNSAERDEFLSNEEMIEYLASHFSFQAERYVFGDSKIISCLRFGFGPEFY